MLSLVTCRPGVFRKKEDSAESTIDLQIVIGHNKTTSNICVVNPKSILEAESRLFPFLYSFWM